MTKTERLLLAACLIELLNNENESHAASGLTMLGLPPKTED